MQIINTISYEIGNGWFKDWTNMFGDKHAILTLNTLQKIE